MDNSTANQLASNRLDTMITPTKICKWRKKIAANLSPVFDGSLNVNILPVSDQPKAEVITDICRQASGVASGLYLEDLIPLCNQNYVRSQSGSGHDIHSHKNSTAVDIKMSTETVKKGDKKKVSRTLLDKTEDFDHCYWIEFFGASSQKEINGVMWYSGTAGHKMLGLSTVEVNWIAEKVYKFRQDSYRAIVDALS